MAFIIFKIEIQERSCESVSVKELRKVIHMLIACKMVALCSKSSDLFVFFLFLFFNLKEFILENDTRLSFCTVAGNLGIQRSWSTDNDYLTKV